MNIKNFHLKTLLLFATVFNSSLCLFSIEFPQKMMLKTFNLLNLFKKAPVIYSVLIILFFSVFIIGAHTLWHLKLALIIPDHFVKKIKVLLLEKRFKEALRVCQEQQHPSSYIIACGIAARKYGPQVMLKAIQAEKNRRGISFYRKSSILKNIAVISPMLGILGTLLSIFYTCHEINTMPKHLFSIFEGIGMTLWTTILGLIVSIFAMIMHTSIKSQIVKLFNCIEHETFDLESLLEKG